MRAALALQAFVGCRQFEALVHTTLIIEILPERTSAQKAEQADADEDPLHFYFSAPAISRPSSRRSASSSLC